MAEASDLRERMERMLECPICMCQFNLPKVLPCQHTYCKACLESILNKKPTIKCPSCRRRHKLPENKIDGFPPNVTIAELIELQQSTAAPEGRESETESETELASKVKHLGNSVRYLRGINEASDESLVIEQRGESIKTEIGQAFRRYRGILKDREQHLKGKVEVIVEHDLRQRREWQAQVQEKLAEATALIGEPCDECDGPDSDSLSSQVATLSKEVLKVANSMPLTSKYHFTFGSNVLKTHITTYGSITRDDPVPVSRPKAQRCFSVRDGVLEEEGEGIPIVVDYYPTNKPLYATRVEQVDDNEFSPFGVAISPSGNILATDIENNKVFIFTSTLKPLTSFGQLGKGNGQLNRPTGIAIDKSSFIFVADQLNNRIQVFESTGDYRDQFGERGTKSGEFIYPCGLHIDTENRVFVCDSGNFRIQVLQTDGTPLFNFGERDLFLNQPMHITVTEIGHVIVTDQKQYIRVFVEGKETHKLYMSQPSGIAMDHFGNMVVGDSSGRLVILSDAGEVLCQIGTCGKGPGQLVEPRGVAITKEGSIVVADGLVHRIQLFGIEVTHDVTADTTDGID